MTNFDSQIKLGERYRDTVTGYEGVATGAFFYLHGCERISLEQWSEAQSKLITETFDSPRLTHVPSGKDITTTKTGGYKDDPASKDAPPR